MKKFINFGSIDQFRNIVNDVQKSARYVGTDDDGNAIFDNTRLAPKITVQGTEKIHGTNASVCYNNINGLYVQSRNNIITIERDNAGCAFFVESRKETFKKFIDLLSETYGIDLDNYTISIYFEFCGGNIQKNSCVSGLDKMAIIFKHFKVSPIAKDSEEPSKWYETRYVTRVNSNKGEVNHIRNESENIFNVMQFPKYEIEIDFERPDLAQNKLVEMTENIETNSGIAKYFNKPDNIGEGIVWTFVDSQGNLKRFKTKGEKHSASKVKKLKEVDSEKEQAKIDFANYACPSWRLEQAWQTVFGIENENAPSAKGTGDFIRAVINDVMKEELDVLAEKGLEPKEVNGYISKVARIWFMEELDKYFGVQTC